VGKAHYIEVFSDIDAENETYFEMGGDDSATPQEGGPPPPTGGVSFAPFKGVLASLRGVHRSLTLRIRGTVQGKCVSVLVDSGATHNFIDAQLVQRRGITTKEFQGFSVLVPEDKTMQCTHYSLTMTMGNYSMTNHFFVVYVPDTNVVLVFQWLYALGRVTKD